MFEGKGVLGLGSFRVRVFKGCGIQWLRCLRFRVFKDKAVEG